MNRSANSTVNYAALKNLVPSNCTSSFCTNMTTVAAPDSSSYKPLLPIGVIIVIVLASACILLGVIYGYVYFTRVSGNSNKKSRHKSGSSRQQSDHHHHHQSERTGGSEPAAAHRDDPDSSYTTHMFLFRKHYAST